MFIYIVQGIALALPSIIVPSPVKIFLISRSLAFGWRSTLPAAFVPLVVDGPILVLSLLILNQLPTIYLSGLRLLGGIFILYLALRALRLLRAPDPILQGSEAVARQSFRQALGISILNPNPYLFWSFVAGPIVLEAWNEVSAIAGLGFIISFYLTFVLGLMALVVIFGTLGRINAALNKILNWAAIVILAILGISQIVIGVRLLLRS